MQNVALINMCMICDKNGNVLLQNRIGTLSGVSFPGGHIEKGESIVDSTIREIKEETNLEISNLKLVGIKHWNNKNKGLRYIIFLFKTYDYKGEIFNDTPEGKVFWYPLNEIHKLKTVRDFDKVLEVMLNENLSEFYLEEIDGEICKIN